jgi:hypothetical protein
MKIACSWHFDENLPLSWGTPQGLFEGFKEAGHDVFKYAFNPQNCNLDKLISEADNYDFIFFCIAGPSPSFDEQLIKLKQSTKTKIFMEFGDDIPQHITGSNFFYSRKHHVDEIFTLDLRCHNGYLTEGLSSNWFLVWCDDDIFSHKDNPDRKNICVTTCYGERPLLKEFQDVFGDKFVHKNIDPKENTDFYNSGTFTYQFARYDEITRRIFEAGGCGNAVLTNRISPDTGIYDLFIEDEDICYYSTAQEAYAKMNKLYADDEYRSKIASNLYNKIRSNHLTKHRVQQVIDVYNK